MSIRPFLLVSQVLVILFVSGCQKISPATESRPHYTATLRPVSTTASTSPTTSATDAPPAVQVDPIPTYPYPLVGWLFGMIFLDNEGTHPPATHWDFDASDSAAFERSDLYYSLDADGNPILLPVNGARAINMGQTSMDLYQCMDLRPELTSDPISAFREGDMLCILSNEGHLAILEVGSVQPILVGFEIVTWDIDEAP